ncbi:unnamed protein product [Phytophthora lilii]|uniref:Unnamed protein product n=1 Tax=Phytophthora lilii TaxID=2077276 RepID=A0A9W6WU09_9STRA|nr:unnamed protein product [Phytophthora lilii]
MWFAFPGRRQGHVGREELHTHSNRIIIGPALDSAIFEPPPCLLMSFLVTEDDRSILSEAFAFIDACGGDGSNADTTDDINGQDDVPSLDELIGGSDFDTMDDQKSTCHTGNQTTQHHGEAIEEKAKQKPTKKRRVRSAETSSTGLQRRKRAELASLRDQVVELEDVLSQLKRAGRGLFPGVSAELELAQKNRGAGRSQWRKHAIEQYRLRMQAEKVNRNLKAIMKNHEKVRNTLGSALKKRSVLYVSKLTRVADRVPCSDIVLSGLNPVDAWMAQLEDTAESIRRHSCSIFDKEQPFSISTSTQCRYDELRKTKIIEFKTATPLNCSLGEASKILWRYYQSERKIVLTMPSRNGAIQAEKLHFLRKFEEENQTLVSWADIMVLPTKRELQFRTEGLVLLAPSKTDPKRACVSRSFLKLYLDSNSTRFSISANDLAYAQDIVLGAMAMKIRLSWQSFQNMMIDQTAQLPNAEIAG